MNGAEVSGTGNSQEGAIGALADAGPGGATVSFFGVWAEPSVLPDSSRSGAKSSVTRKAAVSLNVFAMAGPL
jgi:hypothetical protein